MVIRYTLCIIQLQSTWSNSQWNINIFITNREAKYQVMRDVTVDNVSASLQGLFISQATLVTYMVCVVMIILYAEECLVKDD